VPLIEQFNVTLRGGRSGVRFPAGTGQEFLLRRPLILIQRVPWVGCPGLKREGHEADFYLYVVQSLRMNGVVPLLPLIPSWRA